MKSQREDGRQEEWMHQKELLADAEKLKKWFQEQGINPVKAAAVMTVLLEYLRVTMDMEVNTMSGGQEQ